MTDERDVLEADALQTDRYLDALLRAGDRHAGDAPAPADLDPAVRRASTRLRRDLGRVHPSFRFEERLAARLAEAAAAMRLGAAAGAEGLQFVPGALPGEAAGDAADRPVGEDEDLVAGGLPRPIIIGGAMASALSLAGAAYIAWRRTRPPISPMAWAVRAARQRRLH